MKIFLAVDDTGIEEYVKEILENKATFSSIATHTGVVLDIIKNEMPDIIIISEDLRVDKMGGNLSVPLLIKKIRTLYLGCRVIIIAGDHPEGDEFLKNMVNMGIYDIVYGPQPQILDVIDMVFNPRTYSYGQKLQGITDEEIGEIEQVNGIKVYETVAVDKAKKPKRDLVTPPILPNNKNFGKPNNISKPTGQNNYSSVSNMATPKINNPQTPTYQNSYNKEQEEGTTILTSSPESSYSDFFNGITFDYIGVAGDIRDNNTYNSKNILTSADYQEVYQENQQEYINQDQQNYSNYQNNQETQNSFYNPNPVISSNYEVGLWNGGIGLKKGKIICFTSARQGMGTTTVALNTAYELSKEHSVLLIDGNFGRSAIFSKLGFAGIGYDFENMINDSVKNVAIWNMCVSRTNAIPSNSHRYNLFPASLNFVKLSENTTKDYSFEYIDNALTVLSNHFDYIVVDMCLSDLSYLNTSVLTNSDKVVIVTTQDLYEINENSLYLESYSAIPYLTNKITVCVNKWENGVSPSVEDIASYFHTNSCVGIKLDNKGFLESSSKGLCYLMGGKKKIKLQYEQLINHIK